jgi:aminoglycoside phosphotransferase (APT) family kinase protein
MTANSERPLARGRTADVFADGPGRVRRRYRDARDCQAEAAVMEHARTHGFPVPKVFDVCGGDISMERIDGRSMLADLARRPWHLRSHARLLACLHRRLHAIAAPAWLQSPFGDGRALLHLDLHPENVIVAARGPCVIDWTNAAAGPPSVDIVQTWVLIASSLVPGSPWQRAVGKLGRDLFLASFLGHFERRELQAYLPTVARLRLADENVQERERIVVTQMLKDSASM